MLDHLSCIAVHPKCVRLYHYFFSLQEKEEKLHQFLEEMKGCRLLFQHLPLFVVSFHRNYPNMLKK